MTYVSCLSYSGLGSYFQDSFWNTFDNRISPNILPYICVTMFVWQEIQLKVDFSNDDFINHMEVRIAFCSYILYNVTEQSPDTDYFNEHTLIIVFEDLLEFNSWHYFLASRVLDFSDHQWHS